MNMAWNEIKETVLSECKSDQANIVHSAFEELLRAVTPRSAIKNLLRFSELRPSVDTPAHVTCKKASNL